MNEIRNHQARRSRQQSDILQRRKSCPGAGLRRRLLRVLPAVIVSCLLAGCGKVIFVSGLGSDPLFTVGEQSGTADELAVYLVTLQNQYKALYGEDVFEREGNETLEESLKDNALELLVKVKVLNGAAGSLGLETDETESAKAAQAAEQYVGGLSEADLDYLGVQMSQITQMYEEYDLALEAAQALIADVDREVSDDEARTVTVQSILIKTYSEDADGNRVEFSEEEKEEAYERAVSIRQEIQDGMDNLLGITFVTWMAEYNEDSVTTYTFGKGEVDSAFEEAAFSQEIGTISDPIETSDGYRIIKVIATSDADEIEANKETILEERLDEAYEEAYNELLEGLDYNLNRDRWAEITLCDDPDVTTMNFFEIYNEVFGE